MPQDHDDVDSDLMDMLEQEQSDIKASSRARRALKLEKNDEAIFRLLPARLGARNSFFSRVAKHWLGKTSAIVCPKKTSPHFGGDPDAPCIVCDLSDKYNESTNKAISDAAYSASARNTYTTFGIIREINERAPRGEEATLAHAYDFFPNTFDELISLYKRTLRREGVELTDFERGFDISIARGKRGTDIGLDKQRPLFDIKDDDAFHAACEKAIKSINFKPPTMPKESELDDFYDKALDWFKRAGTSGGREGDRGAARDGARDDRGAARDGARDDRGAGREERGRHRLEESDDAADTRRGRDEAPRSGREEEAPRGGRGESHDDPPRRETRRDEEPPRREREEPRGEEPRREEPRREEPRREEPRREERGRDEAPRGGREEPRRGRDETRDDEPRRGREEREEPRGGRGEEPPRRETRREEPPATDRTPPPAARKHEPPPARRAEQPPAAASGSTATETVDDDDDVTHERREHVAPADAVDAQPEEVDAPRSAAKNRLSTRIREGIGSLEDRE